MLVSFERKNLNLNSPTINENVSSWIEQDIIVPDTKPDAIKIITVAVTPYVSDYEVLNDKIKINGKINYFIIYKVADEKFNTRGLYVSYPYSTIIGVKGTKKDMETKIVPSVKNVIFSLPNERKISVKSEIIFRVSSKKSVKVDLVSKFENEKDIECKMATKKFDNILCCKDAIIASKEDVILPNEAEDLYEILKVDAQIKNTEYKESYNKIMLKGDINLNILYLAENKENMVKRISVVVPFSSMVDIENINEKSKFDISYIFKDFDIRINSDITTTKTIIVEYQIKACVCVYEEDEVSYVEDFYSQRKELNYDDSLFTLVTSSNKFIKNLDIKESIQGAIPPDARLIDYMLDLSYINYDMNQNNLNLSGSAKVSIFYTNGDSFELETKTFDILVNEMITVDNINENSKSVVSIKNEGLNVIQNGQDLDVKISLKVVVDIQNVNSLNVIDNLKEEEKEKNDLDSMNIYIVKKDDTLWSIAKKYKTSIDKILKMNEEIVDEKKLNVGQKIFIIR